ncbi:3-hydroxyacyl-CoA dehydrogenase [Aureimonas flava]|uniref:3-hydroxyacyl-CoA dehydrogenase n=1 Tax=Aureimonas flava TaxID=2320271 RepID=A0A3A1WH68_9HYPH|nr:3-hydroxyacyl-CoA dehydrogenase [Aureimonas flava]RIX98173.1 3-hydroxyacyl-CoA dehydrogenase [Aureimonas flava]
MNGPIRRVAVVGAGLVGSGWAIVFARAGLDVAIFDESEAIRAAVLDRIAASLDDMRGAGLVADPQPILGRLRVAASLEEAVGEADYVQESVFERVEAKRAISLAIDAVMRPEAVVGSSSSGIPASAFTEECRNRARFLVVHPVNPPHLVPLVELVPAPWTDPELLPWLRGEMARTGQAPIVVNREIEGFILNRLQGALLNEAWALFEDGYASAADIDLTVSHGLGLRWSFMGPFETIDLNAPGGIDDYARRLGPLYHSIARSRTDPHPWSDDLAARAAEERRRALPLKDLPERSAWRDRRLIALAVHRRSQDS